MDAVSMEKGRLVTGPGIRVNAVTRREAVQAAEVRHMSYEESDNIEIAVAEGYTLKGKGRAVMSTWRRSTMTAGWKLTGWIPVKCRSRHSTG